MKATGIRFYEKSHRYSIDGSFVVAVTTALNGIPKDGLKYWAARLVGEFAVDQPDEIQRMMDTGGRGPTVKFLAGLPDQKRDDAAARGTLVHTFAEQIIAGEEVEVPPSAEPYVEGYLQYLEDWNPTSVHDEIMVGSREYGYAGRLDSIQDVHGLGRVIIDYKTSNSVYGSVALQVAAYRYAEFFMDGETELPMPQVDDAYCLHIQPGGYLLIPIVADRTAFANFLTAKDNYLRNVQSNKLAKFLGEPIEPPRRDAA